jgi:hypothetical protein
MFENRVQSIHEPKRDEVIGEWRRLQNEGLHDLYSSLNTYGDQIKKQEMGRVCGQHGREERCIQGFAR